MNYPLGWPVIPGITVRRERRMDRPGVPRLAVEYVLFHEMLHVKHPTRRSGCSLVSHSREFRDEEKRFAEFEQARKVLDRLAR